jgi:hypothetical protein
MREGGPIGDIRPLSLELERRFQEHRGILADLFGFQASGYCHPFRRRFDLRCPLIAEGMGVFRRDDVEVVGLAEASPALRNQVRRYGQLLSPGRRPRATPSARGASQHEPGRFRAGSARR